MHHQQHGHASLLCIYLNLTSTKMSTYTLETRSFLKCEPPPPGEEWIILFSVFKCYEVSSMANGKTKSQQNQVNLCDLFLTQNIHTFHPGAHALYMCIRASSTSRLYNLRRKETRVEMVSTTFWGRVCTHSVFNCSAKHRGSSSP